MNYLWTWSWSSLHPLESAEPDFAVHSCFLNDIRQSMLQPCFKNLHTFPAGFWFTTTRFMLNFTVTYYPITPGVLGVQSILTHAHRRSSTYISTFCDLQEPRTQLSGGPPHKHLIAGMLNKHPAFNIQT